MFKNSEEKRFKKRFPNLKQVINDVEVDFDMGQQVPLQEGENFVYLKEPDGTRSVYTIFNVDNRHTYALQIQINQMVIVEKLKVPVILAFICGMLLSFIIQMLITISIISNILISFFIMIAMYYLAVRKSVDELGISAYKIVVVERPR